MSFQPRRYLNKPSELHELSENEGICLGQMKNLTYNNAIEIARTKFGRHALLICTIEPVPNQKNQLQIVIPGQEPVPFEINANDTCYPISNEEWNQFILDEKTYCRKPLILWAVDGEKFTAPI